MNQQTMEWIVSALADLQKRVAHIEARAMSENIKPHETLRQLGMIMDTFNPEGDGSWPLRS